MLGRHGRDSRALEGQKRVVEVDPEAPTCPVEPTYYPPRRRGLLYVLVLKST